ncbi:ABC transporter substrate-binding protein [Stomatohabitans albus]|uniref:ABC transporter substrate-binding protein n=1 Tax=Stomatohabitans albus TaxID=3110766 RepID=UPI00300C944E
MSYKLVSILAAVVGTAGLAACSAPAPTPVDDASASASTTAEASSAANGSESSEHGEATVANNEPRKVMSCTQELTVEKSPQRVITMGDDAMAFLWEMGIHDRVVGMGKALATEVYEPEVLEALKDVPIIEGQKNPGGGSTLSTESILALNPDLVIGYDTGADREALTKAGVLFYSPDAWCPDETGSDAVELPTANFDLVKTEARKYGKLFMMEDKAEEIIAQLDGKIEEVKKASPQDRGTGMAIYIDEGDEQFWAYGKASMVQPQFEAVGLKNVYADRKERLIEGMSMESVLDQNPETIVLLYGSGTAEGAKNTFMGINGASNLDAVKNNKLFTMPFRFTDPPSPNSIRGVEKLAETLGQ